jgi:small subunit ribosomal protein S1
MTAMANQDPQDTSTSVNSESQPQEDSAESFESALSQFEKEHADQSKSASAQKEGIVVSLSDDQVFLDIGLKVEGALLRSEFRDNAASLSPGDKVLVSIKGRTEEGYYALSLSKVAQPVDWASIEKAFTERTAVVGTVTGVVKGGLTVDVGLRAFMPASRSGTRDAAELEKLVGQEIVCRIVKLDVAEEDVVVDRRAILEEQTRELQQQRYAEIKQGDVVSGQVRSVTSYGAFVDLGGIDGLLHVSDMAWTRTSSPEEVVSVGQQVQVKVLKLDTENRRISLGLKQLQPEPWESAADRYQLGQRVKGTVRRLMDFGAFVEVEPGIEGLIHVSEMSWIHKVRKPGDILKLEDTVEAVILSINADERRLSLGLKQALGDPWADVPTKFPAGTVIEGPVVRLAKFGAFVHLAEGVEGLVHISEITAEKRLNHPQEALRVGQIVKAQVQAFDVEKRQVKLSMKQLVPTDLDEFLAEHAVGDVVSGRILEQDSSSAKVELGVGVRAICSIASSAEVPASAKSEAAVDLSALTSMLNARWKGESKSSSSSEALSVGQVRNFRISKINSDTKEILVDLVK